MERLRILAAALALRSFTVSQLAAFAGANEHTVRSVLRREHRFFKTIGSQSRGPGPGRPERRYQIANGKGLRAEVHALEEALGLVGRTVVLPEETDDDRLAALVVAETAALKAVKAEGEEQAILIDTAQRCLRQSKALADDSEERQRRGELLKALLGKLSPA